MIPANHFQSIFESAPGRYLVLSPDFTIVAVSDAYLAATMTRREEILGRNIFEAFPDNPDDPHANGVANLRQSLQNVLREGVTHRMEVQKYDIRRPQAEGGQFEERYWIPINSPVYNAEGELVYIIHRVKDVTESVRLKQIEEEQGRLRQETVRRERELQAETAVAEERFQQVEAELREREEYYRLIEENVREYAIFTLDAEARIVTWNIGAERILGYHADEIIGRSGSLIFTPEDRQHGVVEKELQTAVMTGQALDERWHLRQDGSRFWASGILTSLRDPAGQLRGFVKILRDNTERKRAAEALQEANDRLEMRVKERTAELKTAITQLREQIAVREEAEEKLKRRNRELATLNKFSAVISHSLELPVLFATLHSLLAEDMGLPGGGFLLYDKERDELNLKADWEIPPEFRLQLKPFTITGSHLEAVVREKRPFLARDLREVDALVDLKLPIAQPEWQSYLCVPLVAKSEVQGVLCLFSQTQEFFTGEQIAVFEILGQQMGVAIHNARLFDAVKQGRSRLQHLAQKVVQAQEEERRRVSRELHDEAGQSLTGLLLHLSITKGEIPSELTAVQEAITEAVNITTDTMEGIRRLSHDLRPPSLDNIGLNEIAESLCHDFARRIKTTSIVYRGADLPPLPDMVKTSFYRILQEALTNVTKHAQASKVWVTLLWDQHEVRLSVEDDGDGIDEQARTLLFDRPRGIGLQGMQERLQVLGGKLEISPRADGGTLLVASAPLPEAEE